MLWEHRTAQLGAAPRLPCMERWGEGPGSCWWHWESSFQWCRVQGEDMEAVKHELGASFPLAPCREEEWGGFPPLDRLQPLRHIAARGQPGGSIEPGTPAAPPPLPVRLWGCHNVGAGKDEVALAFASQARSCSWVGANAAAGPSQGVLQ